MTDYSRLDSSELRASALALEASGRVRDAIEAWSELNRRQADLEVEEILVRLRHVAAHQQLESSAPTGSWPRVLPDPFRQIVGRPPEISADQLTTELLGGAILHHGCLLVRGLMATERADELVEIIDAAFDGRESWLGAPPGEAQSTPWFAPDPTYSAEGGHLADIARILNYNFSAVLAADSPRGLFKVVDALEDANIPKVVGDLFGEPAMLTVDKTSLRRVPTSEQTAAWHQDGSFFGSDIRTVDVWVALSQCGAGTDSAGLEILPRRLDQVVECGTGDARVPIEVMPDTIEREGAGIATMCPTFAPGDAMLFDELFLHRTMPGITRPRYALEAWLFAASSCAEDYVPIAL